ncbi:MAG: hypothetical protein ACI4RO_05820, partial [Candidatus Scatosoma sp.]
SVSVEKKLLRAARKKDAAEEKRKPRGKEEKKALPENTAAELALAEAQGKKRTKNKAQKGA